MPEVLVPYDGQDLGPRPHAALIFGQEQIGDFVLATPLMRGLRERDPDLQLDYLGGEGTRQLEEASRLVDARHSLFGSENGVESLPAFLGQRTVAAGAYDLVVNLDAHPLAAQAAALTGARYVVGPVLDDQGRAHLPPPEGIDRLWHDTWNRPDLLRDYPDLKSQFISEIFCRLARVQTEYARCEVPVEEPGRWIPDVLLATGGSRSAKLWIESYWLELVGWCLARGLTVGLLGASPQRQTSSYHTGDLDAALTSRGVADLRAPALTLPQVAGALARARAFVTIDNGLLHVAAAVGAPTVALFGASARRIWAPPVPAVTVLEPASPCTLCEEHRFVNADCLLPIHLCMESIPVQRVIEELGRFLGRL
ncbi:MAG: glycosyltransferase family 9 protein [Chloroflexi bacterium]|nr:glycosyltransferase family 9 protein [Chloroflexota bacterium]